MGKRLDIIVFGATGFTGKFVVEEINRISKCDFTDITWGISGRSITKLKELIEKLQENTGDDLSHIKIIEANVDNPDSLKCMALACKVVINCCGPYRFYGEPLVKACVEAGTHHVDISGEPAYMEKMQLKYNEVATNAGVYIISACGFDSIPSDMGVIYLQQNFPGEINSVETFMSFDSSSSTDESNTAFTSATWEALVHSITNMDELKTIRKQLYPKPLPKLMPRLSPRSTVHKNEKDKKWYVPFHGADKAVISRTQRFLYENKNIRPAQVQSYIAFSSLYNSLACIFAGMILKAMTNYTLSRKLLLKYPQIFSFGLMSRDGPSEETMKNTKFLVRIVGDGWNEKNLNKNQNEMKKSIIQVEISGKNPAYGSTAIAVVYCAITLLKEIDKIPGRGGVLTPGVAFFETSLIEKLIQNGILFKVVDVDNVKSKL